MSTGIEETQPSSFNKSLASLLILPSVMIGFSALLGLVMGTRAGHAVDRDQHPDMPWILWFMFERTQWFVALILLVSVATLIGACGLGEYRNWARYLLVCVFSVVLCWLLLLFDVFMHAMQFVRPVAGQENLIATILIGSVLLMTGMTLLFGWLIKRLLSDPVRPPG